MKSLISVMFFFVTIAGIINIVRSQSCPSECSCSLNTEGNSIIDCSNRGLTEIVEVSHPQIGTSIAKIDFSNNMLTTLDIDKLYTVIKGLIVDELDFSFNSINAVTGTFDNIQGLKDYETLNLSNNAFSSFPENIIPVQHLRTKFIIDFSYNQLTELTAHMFASGNDVFIPGFQFLARNNLISKIHDETFLGVELTDTILDLRYNRLTTLSPGFQSPRGVEALRFSNNPWHCDCNLRWIIAADRFLVNHTASDPPNCQTPVSLRGHPVFTLREKEFTCLPFRQGSLRRDIPSTNTDFTLSCPVTADPPNPEISWTVWLPCPSGGNRLQFDFTSETVTLSAITTNPGAAFRCTATNNAGSIDFDLDIRYNGERGIDIPDSATNPTASYSPLTQAGKPSPTSKNGQDIIESFSTAKSDPCVCNNKSNMIVVIIISILCLISFILALTFACCLWMTTKKLNLLKRELDSLIMDTKQATQEVKASHISSNEDMKYAHCEGDYNRTIFTEKMGHTYLYASHQPTIEYEYASSL